MEAMNVPGVPRIATPTGFVKRKSPRVAVELPCSYSINEGREWDGIVINLSPEGCAVRKTALVRRGDQLRISIYPSPNRSPIELDLAAVRWSTSAEFGVEIMNLSPMSAKRLQDLYGALSK